MSAGRESAEDTIHRWLEQLGIRVRGLRWRRLAGGRSGSGVFRLELDGSPCVLKVSVPVDGDPGPATELRFYRELASPVGIAVPELLAGTVTTDGVALLLGAVEPGGPAVGWTSARWLETAAQLGRLHAWSDGTRLPSWLPGPRANAQRILRAAERWRVLRRPEIADRLPATVPGLVAELRRGRPTLLHGDCHVGNVLVTAMGQLVWIDWTSVSSGCGPEDLALLWQRSEFDGAAPPRAAMLRAYAEARGTGVDASLREKLLAAELLLLLLEWPHFLGVGSPRGRQVVLRRLEESLDSWRR